METLQERQLEQKKLILDPKKTLGGEDSKIRNFTFIPIPYIEFERIK